MTTGQRIAQKRKELSLSQEALGEKLGVSRQSIYKWESDNALPEVEKLVALSRLFGVSVGWLLGVEEEPSPGGAELTEAQLKMVGELAARYAPKPRLSPERLAVVKAAVLLAAVCLCVLLWGFYRRLEDLGRSYSYLQNSIQQVQSGVNGQINSISSRVEELLKSQNGITADHGTDLVDVNLSSSSASFQVYAVPKNYVEGMRAEFYEVNGSRSWTFAAKEGPGQRFEADLKCGLSEDISLGVVFIYPDGSRQTQVLDEYKGLYGQTFPEVRADYALGYRPVENGSFALVKPEQERGRLDWMLSTAPLGLPADFVPKAELKELRVGLFKNRKLVDWAVFSETPGVAEEEATVLTGEQWKALDGLRQNNGDGARSYQLLNFHFQPQEVSVEAGDIFQVAAVIEDAYGRTAVRSGGAFGLDESWGELANLDMDVSDAYPGDWMLEDGSSIAK